MNAEITSPRTAEGFLTRPAVEKTIVKALKKPLAVVVAGVGYGKTQTVWAALMSMKCRSAWMRLSALDDYIDRFWERIARSFAPFGDGLYGALTSLGFPESLADYDRFLRLLEKEMVQNGRFVLVFDDFHLIQNQKIIRFIELLVSAGLQNFSIALLSRKKPDLSLSGMSSKGLASLITEDDLRFSRGETNAYFRKRHISFDQGTLSEIYECTDGWAFAIRLVGLAAQKGGCDGHGAILNAKIDVLDLMEKEVFGSASKELRDFLVKISVLNAMPAGLLRELAGDDLSLVSEAMQMSPFIRYDTFSDDCRFHPLFVEFLLGKMSTLKKSEPPSVYRTAAKWCETNGRISEAIDYYDQCGQYHEIFDIILSVKGYVSKDVADSFIRLIERAPDQIVKKRPLIRVAKAKYLLNNNRIEEARQVLLDIRKEYEASPPSKERQAVLGETYIFLALISLVMLDYQFEELFKMADKCLPDGGKMIDNNVYIAEGLNVCSIRDPSAGELERRQKALFGAAPYASKVMNGCGYGLEYLNAAEFSLYTADLKTAEKYAYEAVYRSRRFQQHDIEYMANFVLARIFTSKGNYGKTAEILHQMETRPESIEIPDCVHLNEVIRGWFYVKIGKPDRVPEWLRHEAGTRKMLAPVHLGREYLVRSDCMLLEEKYYELLAYLGQTDRMYEDRGILFASIQNRITKAVAHHYLGDRSESMNILSQAYELAHPNNLIMQFVEYGNKMRTLIHAAKQGGDCKIPRTWLDNIYTKSSSYAKMLSNVVSAYNAAHAIENTGQPKLSKRELEVLAFLYQGLKREEISANCYLSISTINGIIRNIYNKLGASNAADAVRLAKEKRLL